MPRLAHRERELLEATPPPELLLHVVVHEQHLEVAPAARSLEGRAAVVLARLTVPSIVVPATIVSEGSSICAVAVGRTKLANSLPSDRQERQPVVRHVDACVVAPSVC